MPAGLLQKAAVIFTEAHVLSSQFSSALCDATMRALCTTAVHSRCLHASGALLSAKHGQLQLSNVNLKRFASATELTPIQGKKSLATWHRQGRLQNIRNLHSDESTADDESADTSVFFHGLMLLAGLCNL